MAVDDIDTAEFLAIHHPDVPVDAVRAWSKRLKGLKRDPDNTGKNMEFVFRLMDGWKFKFLDFRGRDHACNE